MGIADRDASGRGSAKVIAIVAAAALLVAGGTAFVLSKSASNRKANDAAARQEASIKAAAAAQTAAVKQVCQAMSRFHSDTISLTINSFNISEHINEIKRLSEAAGGGIKDAVWDWATWEGIHWASDFSDSTGKHVDAADTRIGTICAQNGSPVSARG